MGQPAAKQNDQVTGNDTHIVIIPGSGPVAQPFPFAGVINGGTSTDVNIMGQPAAVVGSTAANNPPHVPTSGSFQKPPTNQATIQQGSTTVMINGKPAARANDPALTCNDPVDAPNGKVVVAASTVNIG